MPGRTTSRRRSLLALELVVVISRLGLGRAAPLAPVPRAVEAHGGGGDERARQDDGGRAGWRAPPGARPASPRRGVVDARRLLRVPGEDGGRRGGEIFRGTAAAQLIGGAAARPAAPARAASYRSAERLVAAVHRDDRDLRPAASGRRRRRRRAPGDVRPQASSRSLSPLLTGERIGKAGKPAGRRRRDRRSARARRRRGTAAPDIIVVRVEPDRRARRHLARQSPDAGLTSCEHATPSAATSAAEQPGMSRRSHCWLGEWAHEYAAARPAP